MVISQWRKLENREVHIWSVEEKGIDLYLEENGMEENGQWRRMESDFWRKMVTAVFVILF